MEYDSNNNYSSNTHCTYLVCACVGVVERGESVSSVLILQDLYYDVYIIPCFHKYSLLFYFRIS